MLVIVVLLDRTLGVLMVLFVDILPELIEETLAQEACCVHPWQCLLARHIGPVPFPPVMPSVVSPPGQNIPIIATLIKIAWPFVQLGQLWWNGVPLATLPYKISLFVMNFVVSGSVAALLIWLLIYFPFTNAGREYQTKNKGEKAENEGP